MIKKILIYLAEKNGLIIREPSQMEQFVEMMEKLRTTEIAKREKIIHEKNMEIKNLKERIKYLTMKQYL